MSTDFELLVDEEYREVLRNTPPRVLDVSDVRGSVDVIRKSAAARQAAAPPPALPEGVSIEDRTVPGPAGQPSVRVRLYRPARLSSPAPALYYVHGGGMVGGTIEMSDAYCATIADQVGALVASVEYRLAPEHPFPAPIEDCYAGLLWLWEQSEVLGIDSRRIAIGGGSAGGGLAAGLALLARDRGVVAMCYQHLVYPMLDGRNLTRSSHAITDERVWNRASNLVGWNAYLDGHAGANEVSAYAAPARATDLRGLPAAYICVGTADLFMDEDMAYAQALRDAGVPVELHVYPGAYHGSQNATPGAALSRRWAEDERKVLERALKRP